jgi:phosphatidylglycerophosphate synthase
MVNKLSEHHECPIDTFIFKIVDKHLNIFYKLGMTPNTLTTISIIFGFLTAYQILKGRLLLASIFWLIGYYFDCADGKFARRYNMVSKFGDLYDHLGDLAKVIAVLLALFCINKKGTTVKQWFFISIIIILGFLQIIHMGYQETIYNKKDESPYLNIIRNFFVNEEKAEQNICYTRYFGCGTWYVLFAILIIFWR